jgi:hypothetical protein
MKLLTTLLAVVLVATPPCRAQSTQPQPDADTTARKALLLDDIRALEISAVELNQPLARAAADAEIASAAWTLDEDWSKKLLRDAYELTLPEEQERESMRGRKIGAPLTPPAGDEAARQGVRRRVLEIAGRDKTFADGLIKFAGRQLGSMEQHLRYAELADRTARAGDLTAAGGYAMRALDAEPTLITAGSVIADIAARDRAAGDQLIIQYIERLRSVPLSLNDHSEMRVYLLLDGLIYYYGNPFFSTTDVALRRQTKPPGPDAMRAYLGYLIESMTDLERREPGSARRLRGYLVMAWEPLRRYAPDLMPAFTELERLTRNPGGDDDSFHSFERRAEDYEKQYERRVKDALSSDRPDELVIQSIISRGDFVKARKLIDKLDEGAQKTQLLEMVNSKESLALSAKGDAAGAEQLAERLQNATFILQVYPPLLKACVASKDQACPARLVYQAVRQLKRADTTPPTPPAGIPASAVPTKRELDRVLLSLSQLAAQVAPVSDALALELLDEIVEAANRSELDTGHGRTGFDAAVFKLLAAKNEPRARQAAEGFKDRLRRIVALSSIYQVKAEALSRKPKPVV